MILAISDIYLMSSVLIGGGIQVFLVLSHLVPYTLLHGNWHTGTSSLLIITQHPETQNKVSGDEVRLVISASGPSPLTHQWWKDGEPITANNYPNCSGIDSPILDIKPFLPENVGSYKCIVSHAGNTVESRSAQLILGMLNDLWCYNHKNILGP